MLKIITDSASDLPEEIIRRFDLHVIPTPVVVNGEDLRDGQTIHTKEFYDLLDDMSNDIKTYHINPEMFYEAFLPYAQNGDEVIYLCFSTGIAGTYNAANLAKQSVLEEYPEFDITIIDSKCASVGFGLLVYKLLLMQKNGAPKEELVEAGRFYADHIRHIFTVKTLTYLIKGGRLSKFKGAVATTLDMKPIITVDENGSLKSLFTVRGRKKSLRALIEDVKEHCVNPETQILTICHGEDTESLDFVLKELDEQVTCKEKVISTVGCAIGAHTGRGIIGICFLDCADPYAKYFA